MRGNTWVGVSVWVQAALPGWGQAPTVVSSAVETCPLMHGTLKSSSTGAVTAGTLRVLGGETLLPVCTEAVEGKPRGRAQFSQFPSFVFHIIHSTC